LLVERGQGRQDCRVRGHASCRVHRGSDVKPPGFEYHRAVSVREAIEILTSRGEDAKILAGGQSLVPMMNFRLARPSALVDITRIPGLDFVRLDDGCLRIGALTKHQVVERLDDPHVLARYSVLVRAARWIGHPPIRTQGTVGGSLAHADPAAEWCVLALLLDAEVVVAGPSGERTIPAADLFTGFLQTALDPAEVMIEVRFPAPAPWASFHEIARRRGDFALVAAGAALDVENGVCRSARVALGGVGATPVRSPAAEAAMAGAPLEPEVLAEAAAAAARDLEPISDSHAGAGHRRRLTEVLARRALEDAARGLATS
jgi:aerobic carbon-monoxide dehydrogenase medium subunit